MNKLFSTMLAGAAVLALSGGAFAADEAARDTGKAPQNQTEGPTVDQAGKDVNAEGRDAGRDASEGQAAGTVNEGGKEVTAEGRDPKKDEYQAELKKCDPLAGEQKKICTDTAKKKHGQM